MLTNSLVVAYVCLMGALSLLWLSQRITVKRYTGWMTVMYASGAVLCAVIRWHQVMYMNVAGAAWFGWLWWHSGGGDGTRRRLKSWAGRFQGIRRTAPSAAA